MYRYIPNGISLLRMLLSLTLFLFEPLSFYFYVIYFLTGLSDILDGYLARKLSVESKLGQRLDSLADLIMVFCVLYILLPVIQLQTYVYVMIVVITLIRLLSLVIVRLKFNCFGIIHTRLNKITGLMLFLFPVILKTEFLIFLLCMLGLASSIEELMIHLSLNTYDGDRKSLL